MDDRLEDKIRDVGAESFANAVFKNMSNDAETPLYPGSTNFTRLSTVLRLMNLKAMNGWTNKSFAELLQLLKDMLPEGNTLPNLNYEAKKKKYFVQWVWSIEKCIHVLTIVFYTKRSIKI